MESSTLIALESWPSAGEANMDLPCWRYLSDQRRWQKTTLSQLSAIDNTTASTSVCVLVPSETVLCTSVHAPQKQHKHLDKILPFLCEEKITADLECVHITAGEIDGDSIAVRIIDKKQLEALIDTLQHWQLSISGVHTDLDLLDLHQAWLNQETFILRTNREGLTTSSNNSAAVINQWLQSFNTEDLPGLHIFSSKKDIDAELRLVTEQWIGQGADIRWTTLTEEEDNRTHARLQALSTTVLSDPALTHNTDSNPLSDRLKQRGTNLLTGRFAPQKSAASNLNWKPIAVAAAVLLTINLIYLVGSGLYWQHQAEQLRGENEALYRQYFPQDRRIINIKAQVNAHLSRGDNNGQSDALRLLADFLPGWQSHRNALKLKSLRYQSVRNELLLDIDANTIADLDQLQQSLGQNAELLSANEDNNGGVRGRLKFQGGR